MYRDDVITMNNNLELRLPFLDKKLTDYALKIPPRYKIQEGQTKVILRDAASAHGLEDTQRPKKAAQYGSYFDKALQKLTKKAGLKLRSEYLKRYYKMENLKIAALISGGKASFYAMHILQKQNYEITCLVTLKSKNIHSYMFHTPNIDIVDLQTKACNIPLITQTTQGEKEKELEDLEVALSTAKKRYGIQGVCSGAIFSNYQRERIEEVCDRLGLKIFSPLWHMNQELEMRTLIEEGFDIIFSSIAADGLDVSWLGRTITSEDVDKLVKINKKIGMNIAGEGGEFETTVLDAPFFKKKIIINKSEIKKENEITARFNIIDASLES
jgi:asparagine synthase (glutamine-hydrolysing)